MLAGLFFMVGTIVALAAIGAVTGFVGKVAGSTLGMYWKLAAGMLMVLFGLISLDVLPFKLPRLDASKISERGGLAGPVVYGLLVGGGMTSCSVGCNPVLPLVIGYSTLQGGTLWGAAVLGTFALGFSLPLALVLVGLGLGLARLQALGQKVMPAIRATAGVILIAVGFYLLWTI
jgi:cytochrome c biogenesis protein CcdA